MPAKVQADLPSDSISATNMHLTRRKALLALALAAVGCQTSGANTRPAGTPYDGDTDFVCFAPSSYNLDKVDSTMTVTDPNDPNYNRFINPATYDRDASYDTDPKCPEGYVAYCCTVKELSIGQNVYCVFTGTGNNNYDFNYIVDGSDVRYVGN